MDRELRISSEVGVIERLLAKHENRIRRFISGRSGPEVLKRTSVEDLYQDTVAAALTSAATFKFSDDARFLAWIRVIARRIISRSVTRTRQEPDAVRIRRFGSSGVGVLDERLPSRARTPSSIVAGREGKAALAEAIGTLPEHYRKVLTLYKLEERPLAEVAKEMERTKGATCRLIARALSVLRQKMGASDEFDTGRRRSSGRD